MEASLFSFVGGDAHIAPLGTFEFALDLHKNGAYRRVDVGIDPYSLPAEALFGLFFRFFPLHARKAAGRAIV